jgi:5-formyltetrahydrofolate cyclo-ligase
MPLPDPITAPDPKLALKSRLRNAALLRRDAIPAEERARAAETIAARSLPLDVPAGAVVSGFSPIRSEINPLPLLRRLAEHGFELALPAIAGRGRPLVMRAWRFGAPLARGQWGIREPSADAAEVAPDIVLVPLAAFDRQGARIGYGAGYYDLTLAALRARKPIVAVGVGFAVQEVPEVPAFPYDQPLDLVLTERETIACRGA